LAAVWTELIKSRTAASAGMGGTSAGGNLALAVPQRMKELGLDLPGAMFAGTPGSDMAKRGDSRFNNEGVDDVIVAWTGLIEGLADEYKGELSVDDPRVSPVLGDFTGFPPTYLVTGTRDMFLSNTVRAHPQDP
jgi:acetyl esterase/lipase